MKFTMTQAICEEGMDLLKKSAPGVDIYIADNQDPNNYLDQMKDTDAIIVRVAKCDGNAINNSPNLKVIGRTGVGYDSVDVKTATARGIPVVITPGANSRSVAEHAIAMMLSLSKGLYEYQEEMKKGNWEVRNSHKAFEFEGKTVGILGMGAIGREVCRMAQGLGMHVLGYDPFLPGEKIEALGAKCFEDYEELLKEADFVTVHVPLTEQTKGMISMKQMKEMKKSAFVINCSRGGIVDEKDLYEALTAGTIAGAGLDVYTREPVDANNPLLTLENVVATPHSAAQTQEAVIKMAQMCVNGCLAVLEGKKWPYVADKKVYDNPIWAGKEWAEI
jgi:D-3-phosphoglycerate dehydrogenase